SLRVEEVKRKHIIPVLDAIREVVPVGFDHHKQMQDEALLPKGHDVDKMPCVRRLISAARQQIAVIKG
ncbi:MAG: hypothetical protein UHN93_01305, partial [Alistipes sp.]|nr:hypothetical protein [Alistipes sp.]